MSVQLPQNIDTRPVTVIGGGTLGRRIALMFASGGADVRIFDLADAVRSAAVAYVEQTLPSVVPPRGSRRRNRARRLMSWHPPSRNAGSSSRPCPSASSSRRRCSATLTASRRRNAILASNSSSFASRLMIDEVSAPMRVLNMHFYMPPQQNAVDLMSVDRPRRRSSPSCRSSSSRTSGCFIRRPSGVDRLHLQPHLAAIKREALAVVADGVSTPEDVDAMWRVTPAPPRARSR